MHEGLLSKKINNNFIALYNCIIYSYYYITYNYYYNKLYIYNIIIKSKVYSKSSLISRQLKNVRLFVFVGYSEMGSDDY